MCNQTNIMVLIEDNTIDGTLDISSRNISSRSERAHHLFYQILKKIDIEFHAYGSMY